MASDVAKAFVCGGAGALGASLTNEHITPPVKKAVAVTAKKTQEVAKQHPNATTLATSTAVVGGIVGGPVGFVAGGAVGGACGHSVDKDVQEAKKNGTFKEGDPGFSEPQCVIS